VHSHPTSAAVIATIKALNRVPHRLSRVRANVDVHARAIGLAVVQWGEANVWFIATNDAVARAIAQHTEERDGHAVIDCSQRGHHAVRIAARATLLASVKLTRNDSEGIGNVDVDASSGPRWKKWVASLSGADRTLLTIYRAGASSTPTRRGGMMQSMDCQFCGADFASLRHFWALCPRFLASRTRLEQCYSLDPGWWASQPRCTAKSGWITFDAHVEPARRADLQVAACKLAFDILKTVNTSSVGSRTTAFDVLRATAPARVA
jgi:hypothetical protein